MLEDALERAISERDMTSLERIIEGAERAAFPELNWRLQNARDALYSLGGGRGG